MAACINWIPTLKAMVSQYYPGLQIGCTEYNWGDEPNLNGATTQADVLGIYGREGFDLATRWTVAKNTEHEPDNLLRHLSGQPDLPQLRRQQLDVSATPASRRASRIPTISRHSPRCAAPTAR